MNNKNKLRLLKLRCEKIGYKVNVLEDGIIDLIGNNRKIRNANVNEALLNLNKM